MRTWDDAFELAQKLSDRCDAFFELREADQARKDAKRARRDGDDPLSAPQTRQYENDSYTPEERGELRTGALSKEEY